MARIIFPLPFEQVLSEAMEHVSAYHRGFHLSMQPQCRRHLDVCRLPIGGLQIRALH